MRIYNFDTLTGGTSYRVIVRLVIKTSSLITTTATATTYLSYLISSSSSDSGSANLPINPSSGFV